jgi:hypothetical protein
LGSAEWSAQFPLAFVSHLEAANSDHSALLLQLTDENTRRGGTTGHFKYETMWETHEDLKATVMAGWKVGMVQSASDVRGRLEG